MKRLFLWLFAALSCFQSGAQSILKVYLSDNSPITVSVDGRYFNKRGTSVTVGDLPYGNHTIKIFGYSRSRHGRTSLDQMYAGRVRTYDGMTTLFEYDRSSGRINTEDRDMQRDNSLQGHSETYRDKSNGKASRGNDAAYSQQNAKTYEQDAQTQSSTPAASPVPVEHLSSMTDAKMKKLKTKTDAKSNDTERMNILKDALKNEKLTTYQVSEIMDWLSFENSKVAFAKWAYDKTSDREYFSDLNQKLTNSTYQEELTDFIKLKK